MPDYPPEITILPLKGDPPHIRVRVPGSKSLTNRALVVAALADGRSTLAGDPPNSADSVSCRVPWSSSIRKPRGSGASPPVTATARLS